MGGILAVWADSVEAESLRTYLAAGTFPRCRFPFRSPSKNDPVIGLQLPKGTQRGSPAVFYPYTGVVSESLAENVGALCHPVWLDETKALLVEKFSTEVFESLSHARAAERTLKDTP